MGEKMNLPKVDIKKILYTTDLSENARMAFAYAVSLANLYDAALTILHVVPEDPDMDEKLIGYISAEQWENIKKQNLEDARETLIGKRRGRSTIRDALGQFHKNTVSDIEGYRSETDEVIVEKGNPVEAILRVSEEKNCDLIVMGSHGYGTLKDAMMGGTARRILRRSSKPVLLVRLPAE